MKIEYSCDSSLGAFVIGENEFVFARGESDGFDEITRLEMEMFLLDNAAGIELFSGPAERSWTVKDLAEFVFGSEKRSGIRAVAELMSKVALSAAKIQGAMLVGEALDPRFVKRMRADWFRWSLESIKASGRKFSPEEEVKAFGQLITAVQLAFNEWLPIGEEAFRFEADPLEVDPRVTKPVFYDEEW